MTRPTILFVDDEAPVLEGLRVRLRKHRGRWDLFFVPGGAEALALLADVPVDVVVSDMRMPDMDGATLLGLVREQYPHVLRIVLSAHSAPDSAFRALQVAHQFLDKPCEPDSLERVIERVLAHRSSLAESALWAAVGGLARLPTSPVSSGQLAELLGRGGTETEQLSSIFGTDPALCAQALRIAGSAFFRGARSVAGLDDALAHIGVGAIARVAATTELFAPWEVDADVAARLEAVRRHSVCVGAVAAQVVPERQQEAFSAGLLHDVGQVALEVMRQSGVGENGPSLNGASHQSVGAYLLALWGLPVEIAEAVASHHAPLCGGAGAVVDLTGAVQVAEILVEAAESEARGEDPGGDVTERVVAALGVGDRIASWWELARRAVGTANRT